MTAAVSQTRLTPGDLLTMSDGKGYELIDGELVERPGGNLAGWIAGELFGQLHDFAKERGLGNVFTSGFGYCCFPRHPLTVLKPSASFVRRGRLANERPAPGFEVVAPDLAAEVVKPLTLYADIDCSVNYFLEAGTQLFWVLNPDSRTATVFRADGSTARLRENDSLDGEDVLPGFSCRLGDLFLPPAESKQ